jgi:hypothetical protein
MEVHLIKNQYINYINIKNRRPITEYGFLKDTNIDEQAFKSHFSSLLAVEQAIWADWFKDTLEVLYTDAVFEEYSIREKILALNYTFVEKIKAQQTFVQVTLQPMSMFRVDNATLEDVKLSFNDFVGGLVQMGIHVGEIVERPFLTDHYRKFLWLQFALVIRFWSNDSSENYEKTDAFIEKSVNFAFDLLARNVADAAFDFIKFLWQNR